MECTITFTSNNSESRVHGIYYAEWVLTVSHTYTDDVKPKDISIDFGVFGSINGASCTALIVKLPQSTEVDSKLPDVALIHLHGDGAEMAVPSITQGGGFFQKLNLGLGLPQQYQAAKLSDGLEIEVGPPPESSPLSLFHIRGNINPGDCGKLVWKDTLPYGMVIGGKEGSNYGIGISFFDGPREPPQTTGISTFVGSLISVFVHEERLRTVESLLGQESGLRRDTLNALH